MNTAIRIALYCILIGAAAVFGQRFLAGYGQRADRAAQLPSIDTTTTNAAPASGDSAPTAGDTPPSDTNAPPTEPATPPDAASDTNAPAPDAGQPPPPAARTDSRPGGPIGWYAALALASLLVLAILAAYDVSHYVGNRAHRVLYNEEGEGFEDPEYDRAEQAWANGEHLEAIRLMREYHAGHPREIHVVFRIAEIYEKDLANTLAAALEYEEILHCKLSPERWGWAAIHLCNLYSRLNQTDKSQTLLRRIVDEVGGTAAARKARETLGLDEDGSAPAEDGAGSESGHKLPPGFKPRKR